MKSAVTILSLVLALGAGGCAGLQPSGFQSPGTAGAPATGTNVAQTVGNDQASVPGTATGGTGSGNIYNQFAAVVPPEVAMAALKVAADQKWTPEQLQAVLTGLAGAPDSVTITGAQTNTVNGGDADNAGAGSGGASGLSGTSGSVTR